MLARLIKEISSHKFIYLLLGIILVVGIYIRLYRTDQILGFYFDQGRDALVVWDLIKNGKFFLIGPTTGLAGIFRGPFYYYLIAPLYWLGNGDPVWPANFLALTVVGSSLLGYYLGFKIQNRTTGLFFAGLSLLAYSIVNASRWLSNPTPMLILSVLLVFCLFKILENKKEKTGIYWVILSGVSGLSLFNFGSSGELFYFPALFIFAIWQRKKLPSRKYLAFCVVAFVTTFAPLVLFDLKHEHILLNNFLQTFGQEKSFGLPTIELIQNRTNFFHSVFTYILFPSINLRENVIILIIAVCGIVFLPNLVKNDKLKTVLLLLLCPFIGLYFYWGNNQVLYSYYMTGYYLVFFLLIAVVLAKIWKITLGKIFIIFCIGVFLKLNFATTNMVLQNNLQDQNTIIFGLQKQAIDWVYQDAKGKAFNVDVYVPPVIPYAYDYLFKWIGATKYSYLPAQETINPLYTIYEVDPPHPERLQAWLVRQESIGRVEYEARFGGIIVQRRVRI